MVTFLPHVATGPSQAFTQAVPWLLILSSSRFKVIGAWWYQRSFEYHLMHTNKISHANATQSNRYDSIHEHDTASEGVPRNHPCHCCLVAAEVKCHLTMRWTGIEEPHKACCLDWLFLIGDGSMITVVVLGSLKCHLNQGSERKSSLVVRRW